MGNRKKTLISLALTGSMFVSIPPLVAHANGVMNPDKYSIYTVKEGDTLSEISEEKYGHGFYYKAISACNNIANPDLIYVDDEIALPNSLESLMFYATFIGDGKEYVVQKGDTLFGICESFYGDGSLYEKLASYNNIINPDHIEIGQVIEIPTYYNLNTIKSFGLK